MGITTEIESVNSVPEKFPFVGIARDSFLGPLIVYFLSRDEAVVLASDSGGDDYVVMERLYRNYFEHNNETLS